MGDAVLSEAYNAAVDALCRFRDAHLRIVALYHRRPVVSCSGPPHARATIANCKAGPGSEACEGRGQTGIGIVMETRPTSTSAPTGMLRGSLKEVRREWQLDDELLDGSTNKGARIRLSIGVCRHQ